ncbi:MAG TPA: hypothetical protein EYP10_01295, partial [Armatimonadetes bacterium]|nr:hypothetical protein [Armatimonadota bacterium]
MALSICLNFVAVRNYALVNRYSGFADHFNTIGVIWLLMLVAIANQLLKRLHQRWALRPCELAIIYAMLMVATVYPTMGFGGYIIPLISGVFYYATAENRWDELLWQYLPSWAVPQDKSVIRWLYEGGISSPPWDVWFRPLFWWSAFALAFFCMSIVLMVWVRRQWVERERLVYPLTQVPAHLTELTDEGHSGAFLRNRLMWLGFAIAFCLIMYNYAVRTVSALGSFPAIPLAAKAQIPRLGIGFNFGIDTLVIGLTYLVNLDVIFSVWFFHILTSFERGILNLLGLTASGPPQPHAAGGPMLAMQQVGALMVVIAWSLRTAWLQWQHARKEFKKHTAKAKCIGDTHGRILLLTGILCTAFIGGFLFATGMPAWSIPPFLLLALVLFFGTSRLLA